MKIVIFIIIKLRLSYQHPKGLFPSLLWREMRGAWRRYPEAHPPHDFSDHGNMFQTRHQLFAWVTMRLLRRFSAHKLNQTRETQYLRYFKTTFLYLLNATLNAPAHISRQTGACSPLCPWWRHSHLARFAQGGAGLDRGTDDCKALCLCF